MNNEYKTISCEEMADILGVNIATIWRYLRAGKLKGKRVGKNWVVFKRDFDEFIGL